MINKLTGMSIALRGMSVLLIHISVSISDEMSVTIACKMGVTVYRPIVSSKKRRLRHDRIFFLFHMIYAGIYGN